MNDFSAPLPIPTSDSLPFWQAAQQGKLMLARCSDCDEGYFYYPRAACPGCLSTDLKWDELSGRATLFTYTVAVTPTHPAFSQGEPLVIALVELEEGPRMTTNIVDCSPENLEIGMALTAVFVAVDEQTTLIKFRPVGNVSR